MISHCSLCLNKEIWITIKNSQDKPKALCRHCAEMVIKAIENKENMQEDMEYDDDY